MINALIFDDEPAAAQVLKLMLERYIPEITGLHIATKAAEARKAIQEHQPQLLFQDIVMPGINGFEFLSGLEQIDFEIIFTTAYDEYAIRAIRFSALDYLLKPINAAELRQAVDRFLEKRQRRQRQSDALLKNLISNLEVKQEGGFRLAVPTVSGALFFEPSAIIRLEGEGNYTRFFLTGGQKHLSSKTLKEYEDMLTPHDFLRIHKSHLVNKKFVSGYQNEGAVILKDGLVLPVSRLRKQEVMLALKK